MNDTMLFLRLLTYSATDYTQLWFRAFRPKEDKKRLRFLVQDWRRASQWYEHGIEDKTSVLAAELLILLRAVEKLFADPLISKQIDDLNL